MNKKFNKNAKVEKFTNMLGKAVRLIVIDPWRDSKLMWFLHVQKKRHTILRCLITAGVW